MKPNGQPHNMKKDNNREGNMSKINRIIILVFMVVLVDSKEILPPPGGYGKPCDGPEIQEPLLDAAGVPIGE